MEVRVGPPTITVHSDDEVAVSEFNGDMSSTKEQGYFVADTRMVSGYRLKIGGVAPLLVNSSAIHQHSARFEFTNPDLVDASGQKVPYASLHLRLDRAMGQGIHEDYDLANYGREPVVVSLEVSIEADFADLFDVKDHRRVRRGSLQSTWSEKRGRLLTTYRNGDFQRALLLEARRHDTRPQFANGGLLFQVPLQPGGRWHACLMWRPVVGDERPREPTRACHLLGDTTHDRHRRSWVGLATSYQTSDPVVTQSVRQAIDDVAGLRMSRHDEQASHDEAFDPDSWVPAAGIPWFLSLFGRDSLTVSLQTLSLSSRFALGSLHALGRLQGDGYDDDRDLQPGKIEHEIRHGELATLHLVPHTPYYGTHEATTLYVLVAALAWQWHGDREALDRIRPHVEAALRWIDKDGDIDGDGFQEYKTRSSRGYYNQGWKDSGEAIVGADGQLAKLPIALCEHQGLVVAAKRAWAGMLEQVYGDRRRAGRLRGEADRLADAIEQRFWWEDEHTYYLGLDGDKRPIESVTSNPGQLLFTGAVESDRARLVAARLFAPDMWSGWGIRTLSSAHVAYNPFSYQLGSVWPHDNALIAAGCRRYGLDMEAGRIAKAMFDAADQFVSRRLPELFAGLERDDIGFPVQYLGANVPQAWASGAVIHLMETLLGLEAFAERGLLWVRPALPEWLTEVRVERLTIGAASVHLRVTRDRDGIHSVEVEQQRGHIEVRVDEPHGAPERIGAPAPGQ
jgi:glycogen debranching enzyme